VPTVKLVFITHTEAVQALQEALEQLKRGRGDFTAVIRGDFAMEVFDEHPIPSLRGSGWSEGAR